MPLELAVKFSRLSPNKKYNYMEAVLWLGIFRSAILILPFRSIAPCLGKHMAVEAEPVLSGRADSEIKTAVSAAVEACARHLPWECRCLVQAMAGKKMLDRRKIPATLYLGVAKSDTDGYRAHAWLSSGKRVLTGDLDLDRFTVVSFFS